MNTLEIREEAGHLLVTLNRPEVRNAIDEAMVAELHEVCADLESNPRVLIITGATVGEKAVFAAGADIRSLLERGSDQALLGINSRLFDRISALPMPVIAAVDGHAIGGGAELAYAADFRIASTRTVFGNPEVGLGILAGAGATWRLIELVGLPMAKEILLAGRTLKAEEALARDLVSSVHEPAELLDAARGLAARIASQDPLAVRLTKRVLQAPREAHPWVDDLAQAILFDSEAKIERMTAFLNKRKASS